MRFQQLRSGIPVLGGELVVNLDADRDVLSVGGEVLPDAVDTEPRVGSMAAREAAIEAVAAKHGLNASRLTATVPSLAVFDPAILGGPGPKDPTLVWRLDVRDGAGLAVDEMVLVHAQLGSALVQISNNHEALDRRVCDANSTATGLPCTAPDRVEGGPPSAIADVNQAYDYAGLTYNFYFDLGRDSLDGAGMPLVNTVRFCPPGDCPFENAFWNSETEQMVYGTGFAASEDVVGHELTHGVTDFTSELFYYYQSGAINESLSDVFGEFVDQVNPGIGTDTANTKWRMGEDVPGFSPGGLRDMENPPTFNDPDRMTSPLYDADTDGNDSGGVHHNSGVNNKAAFLMTDGGDFNGRSVSALGIPKVSRIYYEVEANLLTSGSDYLDLASALPQACTTLIGTAGITSADCTEVGDAVAATEMTLEPTSADAAAPNAPAAVCPSGLVRTDLFLDDVENPAGNTNWDGDANWGYDSGYANSGKNMLYGFDSTAAGVAQAVMTRSVTLPAGATSAYLRFDHAYQFQANGADGGVLEISTNDGASYQDIGALLTDVRYSGTITSPSNPLNMRQGFVRNSNGYRASRATLTSLVGQSVRFRFRLGTNTGTRALGWFIDDVHIYSCAPPPPPPDGDGDGVPDASDACPTVAASTPNGCPATPGPTGPSAPSGPSTPNPTGTSDTPQSTAKLASARVRSCKLSGRGRKARLRCTLRGFGAVQRASVTVKKGRKTVAKKTVRPSAAGVLSFKPSRTLRRGSYKVTIVLRDAAGRKKSATKTLRVR